MTLVFLKTSSEHPEDVVDQNVDLNKNHENQCKESDQSLVCSPRSKGIKRAHFEAEQERNSDDYSHEPVPAPNLSAARRKSRDDSSSKAAALSSPPKKRIHEDPLESPVSIPKDNSMVEVSSPRTMSRSGRNNSPRIDYKTGKRVVETSTSSSTSSSKVRSTSRKTKEVETTARTSTRKRNKEKTPESARSSTTSSPVKKDAKRNLAANDSSDDFVESTPPVAIAASGSTRSRRC